jgi:hypothetical protein
MYELWLSYLNNLNWDYTLKITSVKLRRTAVNQLSRADREHLRGDVFGACLMLRSSEEADH